MKFRCFIFTPAGSRPKIALNVYANTPDEAARSFMVELFSGEKLIGNIKQAPNIEADGLVLSSWSCMTTLKKRLYITGAEWELKKS